MLEAFVCANSGTNTSLHPFEPQHNLHFWSIKTLSFVIFFPWSFTSEFQAGPELEITNYHDENCHHNTPRLPKIKCYAQDAALGEVHVRVLASLGLILFRE